MIIPSTCQVPGNDVAGVPVTVNTMSQASFLATYRDLLHARYTWAQNDSTLALFMISVQRTIEGPEKTWNHDGEVVTATWRVMGGKGKPTLKALRALPRT